MKASGYIRVSTVGQSKEGVSLDAQQERIRAWALANGYDLMQVHVDAGLSGKRADNRPGLQAALAEVCKAQGALVDVFAFSTGSVHQGCHQHRGAAQQSWSRSGEPDRVD